MRFQSLRILLLYFIPVDLLFYALISYSYFKHLNLIIKLYIRCFFLTSRTPLSSLGFGFAQNAISLLISHTLRSKPIFSLIGLKFSHNGALECTSVFILKFSNNFSIVKIKALHFWLNKLLMFMRKKDKVM